MSNQNQGQNRKPQQQQRVVEPITKTLVNVEPVSVIYNIEESKLQEYLERYFTESGVTGFAATRLQVRRQGTNPNATLFVFFNAKDVQNQSNRPSSNGPAGIPQALLDRMDEGGAPISNSLNTAIKPFISNNRPHIRTAKKNGRNLVYLEIDIFRVVGQMLSVRSEQHEMAITEIKSIGKTVLMTVQKTKRFGRVGGKSDIFSDIVDRLR